MKNFWLRIILSGIALIVALLHLIFPAITIDLITLGFVLLAIVPWLAPVIKSIEITGLGRIELQDLEQRIDAVQGAAESASRKAELAVSPLTTEAQPILQPTSRSPGFSDSFDPLVTEYNKIRASMESGSARTLAMTGIMRKMIDCAPAFSEAEIEPWLGSRNGGERLATYARLYAFSNYKILTQLIESVTVIEDKPFGQYWGLQAIAKVLASNRAQKVPRAVFTKLHAFANTISKGTDRDYEVHQILNDLVGRVGETAD